MAPTAALRTAYPSSPPPVTAPTAPQAGTPAMLPGAVAPNSAVVPPPQATAPQAALAQMVQAALPRQNSIASLTAALTAVAGKVALPEPVIRAAQQVLANRVVLDGGKLNGAALQKAVLGSGIFQEAALGDATARLPTAQTDMKSALLGLRQSLATWLGQQGALAAVAQPPPPLRGQVPRAKGPLPAPVDPASGSESVGKQLLDRTDAALSRMRLHQHASLPDPATRNADWSLDLPVVISGQQTLLQMQIHRDEHGASEDQNERGWQMRFAMNVPDMGEVGAQVTLRGRTTGVMLWAADAETSAALESEINALRDTLASVGLQPGSVIVRHGAPQTPAPGPSGHFVDARS
ncbi:flagellar hook-length control protein FliK [Devosia aquimaris]|uniref:flagellar hook-length control protein FliK n=1 Tax=Devosia aquimaris TaxID=2866214 RepID=UPI001CD13287|nr:flagellar hook-length control protein FliK [Devosia sp. CJK-A8-3]